MTELPFPVRGYMPQRSAREHFEERVLHVYLNAPGGGDPQTSQVEALRWLGLRNYLAVDWCAAGPNARRDILKAAQEFQPTLIFAQLQNAGVLSPADMDEIYRLVPGVFIVTWSGDVGNQNAIGQDGWAIELGKHVDLALSSSLTHAKHWRKNGVAHSGYLQIGYDEDVYYPGPEEGYGKDWDAVFLYHPYGDLSMGEHAQCHERQQVAQAMEESGFRVRAGSGVPMALAGDFYRASHAAVSVSASHTLERYSSDRLLKELACGTLVLVREFDDMESWGLKITENCFAFVPGDDLRSILDFRLAPEQQEMRRAVAQAGAKLVKLHHTWRIRMREMMWLVEQVREMRG